MAWPVRSRSSRTSLHVGERARARLRPAPAPEAGSRPVASVHLVGVGTARWCCSYSPTTSSTRSAAPPRRPRTCSPAPRLGRRRFVIDARRRRRRRRPRASRTRRVSASVASMASMAAASTSSGAVAVVARLGAGRLERRGRGGRTAPRSTRRVDGGTKSGRPACGGAGVAARRRWCRRSRLRWAPASATCSLGDLTGVRVGRRALATTGGRGLATTRRCARRRRLRRRHAPGTVSICSSLATTATNSRPMTARRSSMATTSAGIRHGHHRARRTCGRWARRGAGGRPPPGCTEDTLASTLNRSRSTNSKWCSSASSPDGIHVAHACDHRHVASPD